MRVKRRFSTRWGHPYHLPGACAKCRQTLLRPRCFIPSMIPETYMEWPAQNKGEDPSDELILSTLVHEMAHVWQETYGEPSRRGYHNRQWAGKMREVGLQPTSTGEPGGKETGQSITHYIIPEGRYARAYATLASSGFQLHWQSLPAVGSAKKSSKRKFTCPECGQTART